MSAHIARQAVAIDDLPEDQEASAAIKTRLKWFNSPKGFGFVVPENQNIDAFLHVTTLQNAGIGALGEGARLVCQIENGPRGAQVRKVTGLICPGINPQPLGADALQDRESGGNARALAGTVKWYKPEKGFGFVIADDGGKDVFIHKSRLGKAGIATLETGQRVSMTVKSVAKGREAAELWLQES